MKKLILCLLLLSFQQQKKLLKVEADAQTWNTILYVIDLSEAPAKDRVAVKEFIIKQITDTTINKISK